MQAVDAWVKARLDWLGWESGPAYCRWHDIPPDSLLAHLQLPRHCAHPDRMNLTADQSVRRARASWAFAGPPLAVVDVGTTRAAVQAAFDAWAAVCGCGATEGDPQAADLLISTGPIDGPMNVLAQTELPGPAVQHMLVDGAERWVVRLGVLTDVSVVDLERVLRHELGHFWGLPHIPGNNLMAPTYSPWIDAPQPQDVDAMVRRYGPPRPVTPPPPPPPPSFPPGVPASLAAFDAAGNLLQRYVPVK